MVVEEIFELTVEEEPLLKERCSRKVFVPEGAFQLSEIEDPLAVVLEAERDGAEGAVESMVKVSEVPTLEVLP